MSRTRSDDNPLTRSVAAMGQALNSGDESAFRAALAGFDRIRDSEVVTGVRKVTLELQTALARFQVESKRLDLAQREVADARDRLAQVLRLTDDAAHRTMDLVEQCCPLAAPTVCEGERLMALDASCGGTPGLRADISVFLAQAVGNMTAVRSKLGEVLMAQGYQDLSGQIVRGVMTLIGELETALGELARIGGVSAPVPSATPNATSAYGPVVPGIDHGDAVDGQQDVDALLSRLGM